MTINEHKLPKALTEVLDTQVLRRTVGTWELKKNSDAYGDPLETSLGEVFHTKAQIEQETSQLSENFKADGFYGEDAPHLQGPGAIPDILNFEGLLCFGQSGDGSPFCLDYRDDEERPSVVWWDDCYWRRIAPDFTSFLDLLDLNS